MEKSKVFLRTAIGYVRYHSKESRHIYSIAEQEHAIRNYSCENGHKVLDVFKDKNKSGKTFDRAGLQALLKYVDTNLWKVKHLMVSDITRLSTSPEEFKSIKRFLKDRGVKLISLVHLMPKRLKDTGEQPKQHS